MLSFSHSALMTGVFMPDSRRFALTLSVSKVTEQLESSDTWELQNKETTDLMSEHLKDPKGFVWNSELNKN